MKEVIKTALVKDGNLIIHYGREDIPMTRFITIDKDMAKGLLKEIQKFLKKSGTV